MSVPCLEKVHLKAIHLQQEQEQEKREAEKKLYSSLFYFSEEQRKNFLPAKSRRKQFLWCTGTSQVACVVPTLLQRHGKISPRSTKPMKLKHLEWWWMSSWPNWDTSQESVMLSSKQSILGGWRQTAKSNTWVASGFGGSDGRYEAVVSKIKRDQSYASRAIIQLTSPLKLACLMTARDEKDGQTDLIRI